MKISEHLENAFSDIPKLASKVRIAETMALMTMSMFLGGCLVIGFVLVPFWQSMEPLGFLEFFPAWSPTIGITMLSLELMGQIAIIMAFSYNMNNAKTRGLWFLSLISFTMTFALIFIYFAKTNSAFMHATINHAEIHKTLIMWRAMHFVRIGFSALAVLLAALAIVKKKY